MPRKGARASDTQTSIEASHRRYVNMKTRSRCPAGRVGNIQWRLGTRQDIMTPY